MKLTQLKIYSDFFERTKNEPIVIMQGAKQSGKTGAKLIDFGIKLINSPGIRIQCFSESPKQQNFGLDYDFRKYFHPILDSFKYDGTKHIYRYRNNEMSFINIPNNIRADDVANSMGSADERYINEVNMFSKSTFEKLMVKNTGQIFVDFNPYKEFWIQEYITDTNFLKTTWKDNPFLSQVQINLFEKWVKEGKESEVGSYNYWRWQVMCEGNFSELTGEIFTTENIHFVGSKPDGLHTFIIFADPSNAKGGDYFALTLTAIDKDDNMILIDSFSANKIEKSLIAEKIRQWQKDYPVQRAFIETNGEFGIKFYNDCVTAGINVEGWYSRRDKFERIMANFDVLTNKTKIVDTHQNRDFVKQVYTFKVDCANDDNIDCLNNAAIAYILIYAKLKVLF